MRGKFFTAAALLLTVVAAADDFVIGADLSMLKKMADDNNVFCQNGERIADPYAMFAEVFPCARLRLFVNPPRRGGMITDLTYVTTLSREYRARGGSVMLDLHYSDFWADPKQQTMPKDWKNLPFDELCQTVYDHTFEAVKAVKPRYVQIGNEITAGMLWDQGKVISPFDTAGGRAELTEDPAAWQRLGELLKRGIAGAKAADPVVKIVLHIDQGGNHRVCQWFFEHIGAQNIQYDFIGLSYYPFWHGSLENLQQNIDELYRQFGKKVLIVETAHPYLEGHPYYEVRTEPEAAWNQLRQQFPPTPAGQRDFSRALLKLLHSTPGSAGVFYWAPECFTFGDKSVEMRALFDRRGNASEAWQAWKNPDL